MENFLFSLPNFKKGKVKLINSLWEEDVLPLTHLPAGGTVVLAEIEGSGVITHIHVTAFFHYFGTDFIKKSAGRGIILEAYWDDETSPSVRAPLADFFADGFGGESPMYSSLYFEKSSGSWNAYVPMPFRKRAKVVLRNETSDAFKGYATVTYIDLNDHGELLENMGYFHAFWNRRVVDVSNEEYYLLEAKGLGHYIGCSISAQAPQLCFLEGNTYHFVDGETSPSLLSLGLEDYFGGSFYFAYGPFVGLYCGVPVKYEDSFIGKIAAYRFMFLDAVPFQSSLLIKINWQHDRSRLYNVRKVDMASISYWYQDEPHQPFGILPDVTLRTEPCLFKIL